MAKKHEDLGQEKLPCGITADQLAAWKKQYGENSVKHIPVYTKPEDKSHFHSLVVRVPGLEEISKAAKFATEPFKAGLILYNECKLVADPEVEANDSIKASACVSLSKIFKIYESEVLDL